MTRKILAERIKRCLSYRSGLSAREIALRLQTDKKEINSVLYHELKNEFTDVDLVGKNRAVFNIKGNQFRLVAAINYQYQIVYIRFIGTHNDYDSMDATTI